MLPFKNEIADLGGGMKSSSKEGQQQVRIKSLSNSQS